MRYLVLSDIHANIDALEAVLPTRPATATYAAPARRSRRLRRRARTRSSTALRDLPVAAAIRGNHDRAACGLDDAEKFNTVARAAPP